MFCTYNQIILYHLFRSSFMLVLCFLHRNTRFYFYNLLPLYTIHTNLQKINVKKWFLNLRFFYRVLSRSPWSIVKVTFTKQIFRIFINKWLTNVMFVGNLIQFLLMVAKKMIYVWVCHNKRSFKSIYRLPILMSQLMSNW